ncbi:hypothetical protein MCUN1_003213 [Malassezia cuniculi]|uniref:Uncharacterized protein n=1 Tax=Malassezia cuniculi TaxID=948313 RepID=A0AAF0EXJ6_9BASI|nr:hypothetical protein MCUN1_003213 [Malassezia cuniculi]
MATIAQAFGVQPIDMVCIEYRNQAYLEDECAEGAELGFQAKQAIHPAQLEAIHKAFSPSDAGMSQLTDVALARAILEAYEAGTKSAKGAVGLHHGGRDIMIDAYVLF